jgi:fumarylacetoacetase
MIAGLDETHDPALSSWVESAQGHTDFPIQNLPLGVFSFRGVKQGGVAIGDMILDLAALADSHMLDGQAQQAARAGAGEALNALLALGAEHRSALRRAVSALLSSTARRGSVEPLLRRADECRMCLPARIGDYTDFYAGIHHATNIGRLFRPDAPLLPNYKYIPIGYHGRTSSVRVSGEKVLRPSGQTRAPGAAVPCVGPSRQLDYELELGVWIGPGSRLGRPVPIAEAADHVAGLCLLNDWSARDLQAWEYQPLGPFLAKNFLTSISPWIVTAEALKPFRQAQPPRPECDPAPLPYLWNATDQAQGGLAIMLEVHLASRRMRAAGMAPIRLSRGPASSLYWTIAQLVAHHTSNGCDLNPGDLFGTGTISSPEPSGFGSLMEISQGGKMPIDLPIGETRTFLEDDDELILTGRAEAEGYVSIGFGKCVGLVEPAL